MRFYEFDEPEKEKSEDEYLLEEFQQYLRQNQIRMEQALISKKQSRNAFSVERNFINSKEYHDKFEKLPVNRDVQQSIYTQTGRLLDAVDGKEEEHLIAINARTGKLLADNLSREGNIKSTGFNKDEIKKVNECKDNIVLIHNHSLNGRPSAKDILTYLQEKQIRLSIIACHDGTLYGIYDVSPKFKTAYKMVLNGEKEKTSNLDEAKRLTTTKLYQINDKLSEKHKLFIIKKL